MDRSRSDNSKAKAIAVNKQRAQENMRAITVVMLGLLLSLLLLDAGRLIGP